MEEKKAIKVSLGTVICIVIILILIFSLIGVIYYYNSNEKTNNKKEISAETEQNIASMKNENIIEEINKDAGVNNSKNIIEDKAQTSNIQIGKKYVWEIQANYDTKGNLIEAGGGDSIIFNSDNTVNEESWAIPGGGDRYNGTYKIEGDKITVILLKFEDGSDYPKENNTNIYTIVDNTQIKDSEGRVYKIEK